MAKCSLSFEQALRKIGKAKGESKFNDAMGGAILPSGYVGVSYALSLIYDRSLKVIRIEINRFCEIEFKACFEKLH